MSEKIKYRAPKKPHIRMLGTIKCDVVEITPVVFKDRLYRLEYFRAGRQNSQNTSDNTYLHFIDVYTNQSTKAFAENHHFGTAFVDGEQCYHVYRDCTADDFQLYVCAKHQFKGLDASFRRSYVPEGTICRRTAIYTIPDDPYYYVLYWMLITVIWKFVNF